MLTASAALARRAELCELDGVADRRQLHELGIGPGQVAAQVAAGRWRLCGCAIVLHNAQLTREQRWTAALVNCGPRSVLTSFTAAHAHGLRGWDRDEVHVLAPAGTKMAPVDEFAIRLHLAADWSRVRQIQPRRLHDLAQATVLAASSFAEPRSASGLLAATVQQRLLRAGALAQAVEEAPRLRHRAAMVHAVADIEQGAQALSEIDFVRLCRRNRLPKPTHQAVRRDASGRRRYLDASWTLPGDRIVAVEVDGALAPQCADLAQRSASAERARARRDAVAALSERRRALRAAPRRGPAPPGAGRHSAVRRAPLRAILRLRSTDSSS